MTKDNTILDWYNMSGSLRLKKRLKKITIDAQSIILNGYHINDIDVILLMEFLTHHPNVTYLNLNNNQIGDAGAIVLAKNHNITKLSLAKNQIGNNVINVLERIVLRMVT